MESPRLETRRRWLEPGIEPSMPFYVEFPDGRRGEAALPIDLMDMIIAPDFSDISDVETLFGVGTSFLRDLAARHFSFHGVHCTVYDAIGPVFDNSIALREEQNEEVLFIDQEPIPLDSFDAWTIVASLIEAGYLRLFEKIPVWSDERKNQSCGGCIFRSDREGTSYCEIWRTDAFSHWEGCCPFITEGSRNNDYVEVTAKKLTDRSYKPEWLPFNERTTWYSAR